MRITFSTGLAIDVSEQLSILILEKLTEELADKIDWLESRIEQYLDSMLNIDDFADEHRLPFDL